MKEINFDNILGTIYGIPVIESKYTPQNTVIIINKKTGVGKIIAYEERIEQLCKENSTLKKQLSEIKYLDRDKVNKYLWLKFGYRYEFATIARRDITEATDKICSLALPTRERIMGVLNKHLTICSEYEGVKVVWTATEDINFEAIATEILGEEREDENK